MPTRLNSPTHKEDVPQLDAASVALLREAEALILGIDRLVIVATRLFTEF